MARISQLRSRSDDEVFVENSPEITGRALGRRLLALGWSYACTECGLSSWRGRALVLHVDHKNGIHNDNRLVNLRFLCPNCHSQTDTYCNRKRPLASCASEARQPCYTDAPTRAWRNWYPR